MNARICCKCGHSGRKVACRKCGHPECTSCRPPPPRRSRQATAGLNQGLGWQPHAQPQPPLPETSRPLLRANGGPYFGSGH